MKPLVEKKSVEARETLVGLNEESVQGLCSGLKLKPFHTRELLKWIYNRRNLRPGEWTNLPLEARREIAARCETGLPRIVVDRSSSDKTRKLLLELVDGARFEVVLIPDGERNTLCVSSQVGCAMGCAFCLTGKLGFVRNLSAGEILGQFFVMEREARLKAGSYNVVFMGMGEPLANLRNLKNALGILENLDWGMGFSRKRITVSTAGVADSLEDFIGSAVYPRLAISLNAADDGLRSTLMPLNRRFPLKKLREILQKLSRRDRDRVSLEYVLLREVNDSRAHAQKVADFAMGLKVKINLIPFNPVGELPFKASPNTVARSFQRVLLNAGIPTSVRRSRGADILAACGQLAHRAWPEGSAS